MMMRFIRDEKGAVTIEFTVLVPFFILLMVLFVDSAVTWLSHSEMFNAARDISRRMSTGELTTRDEVASYAASHIFLGERTYDLIAIDDDGEGNARVTIEVPVVEAAIFGVWFRPLIGQKLVATSVTRNEPPL